MEIWLFHGGHLSRNIILHKFEYRANLHTKSQNWRGRIISSKLFQSIAQANVTVTQRNTKLKERLQGKTVPMTYTHYDEETQTDMAAEEPPHNKYSP